MPRAQNVRGRATRREAASLRFRRRSAHGRKTQLAQGEYVTGGKLRGMKRPACLERQTGACRRCGLAVSQPCRGREEPVETTDAFRPTGGGRGAESGPSLMPNGRSDQPQPPDRCPVTEAINFQPQDGCPAGEGLITPTAGLGPRTKDQRQLRRFGPRCLRRTNVNSASAAFPRGRPGESESSSDRTRATGITHPGFYGRKPWKKPNSTLIIDGPRPAKEGLRRPFRKLPPNRSQKLPASRRTPGPATATRVGGSACSEAPAF